MLMRLRFIPAGLGTCLMLCTAMAFAVEPSPLPDPLTLDYALSLADEADPALEQAQADVEIARAGVMAADARTGVNVSVEGRLRWIEPADVTPDTSHDDNKLSLFVRKNLYDFGRSNALEAAASAELAGREQLVLDGRQQRRLAIMRRYFEVLQADVEFARDDEAMAVAYVDLDRLRQRRDLGQASDLDVQAKESEYQQVRRKRYMSESRMRATRAQLAIVLNRPGQLPANLAAPDLPQLKRELPDYQALLDKALADNHRLLALRERVKAAQQMLDAAYAGRRPQLNGELEASSYSRSIGSNDKLRAGIYIDVPLYDGGTTSSAVARRQAELYKVQAQLTEAERDVRQAVLDQWLELSNLKSRIDEAAALRNYRELYLDRSRAIYEMEVKTDLGDAMVRLSEAQLAQDTARYAVALGWERMDALTGGPVSPLAAAGKP